MPRYDRKAWQRITLGQLATLNQNLQIRCTACGHETTVDPGLFGARHDILDSLPLLLLAKRLACSTCGERRAEVGPS
jgi:hypothetical protein